MEKYIYIALFAPLVGSLVAALFSMQPKTLFTGWFTSFMLAVSMYASLYLLHYVYTTDTIIPVILFDWIVIGNLDIPFGFVVDHVSVVMMTVVTVVSTMVHIHSIGYMDHDKGFNRYFSYLSAFVFSMLVLVMSDNFAVLFIGWEGVGVCSWLLIGFWYHKESASWAANEAFIMNRVGDLGLLLGMFLIYWNIGSLQYDLVFSQISKLDNGLLVWIGALLFLGAMGKSAQFPLHTWLADAMEGPTPVSALIHAATMVTAGVYLVIRSNELYSLIPEVGYAIAGLGAFVAIFAATMALVNNDMKRVIAYSTLSQLGYMFVAAGLGAYWVALFHLAAHAFFKSVLFLGAGRQHRPDESRQTLRPERGRASGLLRRALDQGRNPRICVAQLAHGQGGDHQGPAQAVLQPAQVQEASGLAEPRRGAGRGCRPRGIRCRRHRDGSAHEQLRSGLRPGR
jgi:NADH-quinone oxidoreductase subunit L